MKWLFLAVLVLVAGSVAVFAIYTFAWREDESETDRDTATTPSGTFNVFVSATGSDTDSNCMRFSSPIEPPADKSTYCRNFQKAYQLAANGAGDRIGYTGALGTQVFSPDATKVSANDVVFSPLPGATPSAKVIFLGADHITLEGPITSTSILSFEDESVGATCGTGNNATDITVRDFISTERINFKGAENINVYESVFDARAVNAVGEAGSFWKLDGCGQWPKNTLVEGSYFYGPTNPDHAADCVHIFDGEGLIFRKNYFEDCESYGILFNRTSGATPAQSIIEQNRFGALGINAIYIANPVTEPVKNLLVQFNSMVGGITISSSASALSNVVMRGNIRNVAHGGNCTVAAGLTWEYNLNHDSDGGTGIPCSATDEYTEAALASIWVDWPSGNFRLANGSPAIGIADGAVGFPTIDYEGNSRPLGLLDAGASERN